MGPVRSRQVGTSSILFVMLFGLMGCVSAADGPSPTDPHDVTTTTLPPTTTTSLQLEDALIAFRECLATSGVSIEDIEIDGRGRPRMAPALEGLDFTDRIVLAALEDCALFLMGGVLGNTGDPELGALVRTNLMQFALCIQENGVSDFPDPIPGYDGVGSPFPLGRVPWEDPALPNAVTVCSRDLGRSLP